MKESEHIEVYYLFKISPLYKLNFWHYLAYQIDKRLYQYALNPFEQISPEEIRLSGAILLQDLAAHDNFDCIITSLNHISIDDEWLSKSKQPVIQWRIPTIEIQNAYLLNRIKINVFYTFFTSSLTTKHLWFKQISLENGIVNAYEKYAWYSSVILKSVLFDQISAEGEYSFNKEVKRRYSKIVKLYYQNLLYLIMRKFVKTIQNWKIAYITKEGSILTISQPPGTFWADPFPIQVKNKTYVFFEEMNFATQLGEIAYLELDAQNNILQKHTVLKNNTHFSFPNVFECEGAHYMLPENVQSNQLVIYKAHDFPDDWRPFKVLMNNIKLLDPIWFYHEGYYWIMGNKIHEFEYENNNALYVYFAKDLFAQDWTSHPMNPVVTDAQFARNAGRIFSQNNKLYRVAQNCSLTYGENLSVIQIENITPTKYLETVKILKQAPLGFKGLHTFNKYEEIVFVDLLKRV